MIKKIADFFNTVIIGCLASIGSFTILIMVSNISGVTSALLALILSVDIAILLGYRYSQRYDNIYDAGEK